MEMNVGHALPCLYSIFLYQKITRRTEHLPFCLIDLCDHRVDLDELVGGQIFEPLYMPLGNDEHVPFNRRFIVQ